MNAVTFDNADMHNAGLMQRRNFTADSRVVDMIRRIYADLFLQSRCLLNEVNEFFKLTRSRDAFCTISPAGQASKVKTAIAIMFVRKVKLSPSTFLAHSKAFENATAKYPINRVVCKTLTIPANLMDVS